MQKRQPFSGDDIKRRAKKRMEENGNEKISHKELLWFMVDKFDEYEGRISKLESTQKICLVLFPIITSILLALIYIL